MPFQFLRRACYALPLLALCLLCVIGGAPAQAAKHKPGPQPHYHQSGTISIPGSGAAWCFDTGWFDSQNRLTYLADASNGSVDVIDAQKGSLVGTVGQGIFTGPGACATGDYSHLGPAGVLVDDHQQLWASNGDSSVKVFNIAHTPTLVASIDTGGLGRTDEMAYDPKEKLLIVNNPDETTPFSSFISTTTHTLLGKLYFPLANAGLEQPVWNQETGLFYMSIPNVALNSRGGLSSVPGSGVIAVISPLLMLPIAYFPVPNCMPSGLALGDGQAAVGCIAGPQAIIDLRTGCILARLQQVTGVDVVSYDAPSHEYAFAAFANHSGPEVALSDQQGHVRQTISTTPFSHSVVVATVNGKGIILIPERGVGVAIYTE